MNLLAAGNIAKMKTTLHSPVFYQLPVGDSLVDMNALIGKTLRIEYSGIIHCVHCDRKTKKSFNQGYCYPCLKRLAQCDSCIISPEKCHYEQGTCREPEWGDKHCMIDHIVYLANSSGLKVGITRGTQIPTRWIDQGALQAIPILRVSTRYLSGLCEVAFKTYTADKTNWRKMLKNEVEPLNLFDEKQRLFALTESAIDQLIDEHGLQSIQRINDAEQVDISYPVEQYPIKVSSFNLDKVAFLEGTLMGIKGQYLLFDNGVINMRKYTGYALQLFEI